MRMKKIIKEKFGYIKNQCYLCIRNQKQKYMGVWGKLSETDDKRWEELTDKYMPASGKADSVGGEIIRAMNRLVYRYYNDGDTISRFYGCAVNYLITANAYIRKYIPAYIDLEEVSYDYEVSLCKDLKIVLDYLVSNPNLFEMENTEDFIENAPRNDAWYEDTDEDDEDW